MSFGTLVKAQARVAFGRRTQVPGCPHLLDTSLEQESRTATPQHESQDPQLLGPQQGSPPPPPSPRSRAMGLTLPCTTGQLSSLELLPSSRAAPGWVPGTAPLPWSLLACCQGSPGTGLGPLRWDPGESTSPGHIHPLHESCSQTRHLRGTGTHSMGSPWEPHGIMSVLCSARHPSVGTGPSTSLQSGLLGSEQGPQIPQPGFPLQPE